MDVRTLNSWAKNLKTKLNSWSDMPKTRKSVGTIQDVLSGTPRKALVAAICNGGCASCGAAGCDGGGGGSCTSCGVCGACSGSN